MYVIQPGGTSVGGTASSTSSTATAIPPLSNGDNPKWVYVCTHGAGALSVVFGGSTVSAATITNGVGIGAYSEGTIINVAGNSHYRIIANVASQTYSMTPLAGISPGG